MTRCPSSFCCQNIEPGRPWAAEWHELRRPSDGAAVPAPAQHHGARLTTGDPTRLAERDDLPGARHSRRCSPRQALRVHRIPAPSPGTAPGGEQPRWRGPSARKARCTRVPSARSWPSPIARRGRSAPASRHMRRGPALVGVEFPVSWSVLIRRGLVPRLHLGLLSVQLWGGGVGLHHIPRPYSRARCPGRSVPSGDSTDHAAWYEPKCDGGRGRLRKVSMR